MGKVAAGASGSWHLQNNDNNSEGSGSEKIRKKRHKRDLEEIRRNALAAKLDLRSRGNQRRKPKTNLMKTLNNFASTRQEIEDAHSQGTLLNNSRLFNDQGSERPLFTVRTENKSQSQIVPNGKSRIIKDQILPKPLNLEGFFRGGIKGKMLTRPLTSADQKFKEAVLQGDALKLMQSGNFYRSPRRNAEPKDDNLDPLAKMELSKILKEFSDSSDTDDPLSVENRKSSPVFGGTRSLRKKVSLIKPTADVVLHNVPSEKKQSHKKRVTKEDKCKRRLFDEENLNVNNGNSKCNNNEYDDSDAIRYSQRKSTPENVIFFTEHVPAKKEDNQMSKKHNHKISPTDPSLVKFFGETFKDIAHSLKDCLSNDPDSLVTVKADLRTTHNHSFKDCIKRQKDARSKQRSDSESSDSEIMLEPDSVIARTLKKNNQLLSQNVKLVSENNSEASTTNLDASGRDFPAVDSVLTHHLLKRKYAPSSKSGHSEVEDLSSVIANADPDSVRLKMKMDSVHSDRQELVARYLHDVHTNNSQQEKERTPCNDLERTESEFSGHCYQKDKQQERGRRAFDGHRNPEKEITGHHYEKEKLFISDNSIKQTYFAHKSTKYVPAILRKNRSAVDCVAEEKIVLSIEKCPERTEVTNISSIHDFNIGSSNLISERTPNCGNAASHQSMEAPKCKHMYMNAKYNQPPRINAPIQAKNLQRNLSPQNLHLFPTPYIPENAFVPSQSVELSPMEKQLSVTEKMQNFQFFKLSQESSGDIQERTDRLTLSSQNQNCSQESVDRMYATQQQSCNSQHSDFYFSQFEPLNNRVPCNPQHATYNRVAASQSFDAPYNPNAVSNSQNVIMCKGKPTYVTKSQCQMPPPERRSFQGSSCYVLNDGQLYINQNSQQHQEPSMACLPVKPQNSSQPVKFMAIEGNRIPQRRPIYGAEETNSCSHMHKSSVSHQQYTQVLHPCFQRDGSSQPRYTVSSMPYHSQDHHQSLVKYDSFPASNLQRQPHFTEEFPGPCRNTMNFVPNNVPNQNFVPQRSMPIMHAAVHSQRYVGQSMPMQMRMPSPVYTQVAYQPNHRSNNEVYKVNDIYLQEMNHGSRSQRP